MHLRLLWQALLLLISTATAIKLDIDSEQSIKDAASTAVYAMMTYYHGNETGQIPGSFPTKWWEGSALFLALLRYWHFTGDTTYNDELAVGLEWQSGDDGNYMPSNYSSYLGNDDQMFWGLAAMTATEFTFPDVPGKFSWLELAQGVFNTQTKRWDTTTCEGGLRWQIYQYQSGYAMKNAISNGGLFQLAARLAWYSSNATYVDWANKIWQWSLSSPLLENSTWNVADSTTAAGNCDDQGNEQWSYNYGSYLMGAAYMYNHTNGSSYWLGAVNGLMNNTIDGFTWEDILYETHCEPQGQCNYNEMLFKGIVSSWLSSTAQLVPSTYNRILPILRTSAQAAAKSCSGHDNNTCGLTWYDSKFDGYMGMEEEIIAANIFVANLIAFNNTGPVTSTTGGNSTSNPNAGEGRKSSGSSEKPITTADRAGAGILTALCVLSTAGLLAFTIIGG